ncbi:MAG: hypothetical protein H7249_04700 [Chitinophagaceae bacterium]|nr:hypothetical protein [Oligoflexus sp.]
MVLLLLPIIACAFLGAVLSTLPIGPVNLLSFFFTLNGKRRLWLSFIAGILLADTISCLFAMHFLSYNSSTLLGELKNIVPYIGLSLAVILVILGVRLLRSNEGANFGANAKYSELKDDTLKHRLTAFGGGFIATAMSPGLYVFWMAWWLKWITDFTAFHHFGDSIAATFGLCAGDLLVFLIYRHLALRFGPRLIGTAGLKRINQGIGAALIGAAALICFTF